MAKTGETYLIEGAGAMPAATWNNLRMNDVDIEIPCGLALVPRVRVTEPWTARGAADEFANALADAQEEWEKSHPAPSEVELAERAEFLAAEADATYGGTAQSAYQVGADAIEEARSLSMAFETGLGDEMAALLRHAAGERIVIQADPGKSADAQVVVEGAAGEFSVAAIDVIAGENSTVNLSLVVDSPQAGEASDGFTGTTLRVFADVDARVNVTRVQTLDEGFTDFDDMGLFACDRGRIEVRQTILGAGRTFTGLAGDLRGTAARADLVTHYLGHGEQVHDLNYIMRHHGEKTECELQANGVLAGKSQKTLRGTIDLIRGAKGAQGSENETVLLVDDGVRNKTVPVILCNEDDVAGNHGATIGHIREEQMFYLASRGISREAAEQMFVGAIMEQAAIEAVDDEARAGVVRLAERIAPGFAELFDGGL